MRSKYDVDVRRVANEFGGGGHKNAAGFTVTGALADLAAAHLRAARRRRSPQGLVQTPADITARRQADL